MDAPYSTDAGWEERIADAQAAAAERSDDDDERDALRAGVAAEAAKIDAERATYRRELAELRLLDRYDDSRRYGYGDYGGAQRYSELVRRGGRVADLARELALGNPDGHDVTDDELRDAFDRVGRPRYERLRRRYTRDAEYNVQTRPTLVSIKAWRALGQELGALPVGRGYEA